MSISYFLVCMQCKTGVLLGKAVPVNYSSESCFGFSQLGETLGEGFLDVQQFLMAHRVHELRVLPGNVEEFASDWGVPHGFPSSGDIDGIREREALAKRTKDAPIPEEDISKFDSVLIEKLRLF